MNKEDIKNFKDPFEEDLVFSATYQVGREAYYEYLKEQDLREVPQRRASALRTFIIEVIVIAVVTVLILLSPEYRQPLFFWAIGFAAVGVALIFLQNYVFFKGNTKFIEKLRATAEKKGRDVRLHVRLEIYKEEIYVDNGPVRYYVRPVDIEEWFETEHLLAIRIRQLKTTPCRDLERILIPKELAGDRLGSIEETISSMIRVGDKVLARMEAR